VARQTPARSLHLLAHGAGVADDAPRPFKHALALGRQSLEPRAALHQRHTQLILQLLDRRRQRRLGDAALLRGMAEMAFAGENNEEFKLVDHGRQTRMAYTDRASVKRIEGGLV
jgi:hypothetical protein